MAKGKKRSRSRKAKPAKKAKKCCKKAKPAKKAKRKATARGPWLKKTYKAKNGARYVKNAKGQVKFVKGASKRYMAKLRKLRKGKKK